jgi:hypothetical protein
LSILCAEKLFMSKTRVESMWYHESAHISIVSVDALSDHDSGRYTKVALFCLTEAPAVDGVESMSSPPVPARRSSFSMSLSSAPAAPAVVAPASSGSGVMRKSSIEGEGGLLVCGNKFSIDIGSSEAERTQLEVCGSTLCLLSFSV